MFWSSIGLLLGSLGSVDEQDLLPAPWDPLVRLEFRGEELYRGGLLSPSLRDDHARALDRAIDAILVATRDVQPELARGAACLLPHVATDPDRAARRLAPLLWHEDPVVALTAIRALGRSEGRETFTLLEHLTRHASADRRAHALLAWIELLSRLDIEDDRRERIVLSWSEHVLDGEGDREVTDSEWVLWYGIAELSASLPPARRDTLASFLLAKVQSHAFASRAPTPLHVPPVLPARDRRLVTQVPEWLHRLRRGDAWKERAPAVLRDRSSPSGLREAALLAWREPEEEDMETLLPLVDDGRSLLERRYAIQALGRCSAESARDRLREGLLRGSALLRPDHGAALLAWHRHTRTSPEDAISGILAALESTRNPQTHVLYAWTLARAGSTRTIPRIRALAENLRIDFLQGALALALAHLCDDDSLPWLERRLLTLASRPSRGFRLLARALRRLGSERVDDILLGVFEEGGPNAVSAARELVWSHDPYVRARLIAKAVDPQGNQSVRAAVFESLATLETLDRDRVPEERHVIELPRILGERSLDPEGPWFHPNVVEIVWPEPPSREDR